MKWFNCKHYQTLHCCFSHLQSSKQRHNAMQVTVKEKLRQILEVLLELENMEDKK